MDFCNLLSYQQMHVFPNIGPQYGRSEPIKNNQSSINKIETIFHVIGVHINVKCRSYICL